MCACCIIPRYFCCSSSHVRPMILYLMAIPWCALQKYGVPNVMIEFIQSLHDGTSATVTVSGELFLIQNELCQGCTTAPILFVLCIELPCRRKFSCEE